MTAAVSVEVVRERWRMGVEARAYSSETAASGEGMAAQILAPPEAHKRTHDAHLDTAPSLPTVRARLESTRSSIG